MKLFTGWAVSAGLVLAAAGAHAQVLAPYANGRAPYTAVSDVDGPYAAMPPERGRAYGYGPTLLPPPEVYTVLRENGFSPLGIPQQRGFVYTIAVIDRGGDDGRLVIDARNGRIIRFMPAYRMGDNFNDDLTSPMARSGRCRRSTNASGACRGRRRSIPHVASRTVPVPKAAPARRQSRQARSRQPDSAAIGGGAAEAGRGAGRRPPAAAATVGQAKPAPADPADAGNAEGAGAGVDAAVVCGAMPMRIRRMRAIRP